MRTDRRIRALRFNTCSSCEEQPFFRRFANMIRVFQYMLLLRGATSFCEKELEIKEFQYMLLLRGATHPALHTQIQKPVSIHAPLARSNVMEVQTGSTSAFQYMLLLRGATH